MLERVGGFGLVSVLGSGGFGTVYEGVDLVSGGRVAVKVLDRMGGPSSVVRSQLLAEAGALRSVVSANTLRVVDVIDSGGVLALVTDFVPGCSLRSVLDTHGVLSGPDALTVLYGAGLGLAAVHEAGLVHGDVKPANILVGPDGTSRLIDFGLVSLPGWVGEDAVSPWGSPAYAPPELVADSFRDRRSDIYSLTVTLFEVLCGRRPFGGDTVDEVRSNHVHQGLPDPRVFVPDLGDGLTQLLLWGLVKDPDGRPQDVGTWLQYLEAAAEQKYGPGWSTVASVGAIAGAVTAGGVVASGVLAAPAATGVVATGAGGSAGAGAGAGAAGGAGAGAGAAGGAGAGAGAAGGAGASSGAGAAAGAAKGGLLATGIAKTVAIVATAAIVTTCGLVAKTVIDHNKDNKPAATTTPAAAKPKMVEKITFTRCDEDGESCAIYTINPDGKDEQKIVDLSEQILGGIAWSPDGKQIAYAEDAVYTVNADGTGSKRRVGTGLDPVWSPDGKELAFAECDEDGCNKLVVVNADGSNGKTIDARAGGSATWSPDSKKLAYTQSETSNSGCSFSGTSSFVINADGSGRTELSPDSGIDTAPVWLPDSKRLLIEEKSTSGTGEACERGPSIHMVNVDGSGNTELIADAYNPTVSRDGKNLMFRRSESVVDNRSAIYLADRDGTKPRKVVGGIPMGQGANTLSPSGDQIIYTAFVDGETDVFHTWTWIVNADGSHNRRLMRGSDAVWGLVPADDAGAKVSSTPQCPNDAELPAGVSPVVCTLPANAIKLDRFVATMDDEKHLGFVSPDRNISCLGDRFDGTGMVPDLDCIITKYDFDPMPDPPCPATVTCGGIGPNLGVGSTGVWHEPDVQAGSDARRIGVDGSEPPVLRYGQVADMGDSTYCSMEKAGMSCWNTRSESGFFLSRGEWHAWETPAR